MRMDNPVSNVDTFYGDLAEEAEVYNDDDSDEEDNQRLNLELQKELREVFNDLSNDDMSYQENSNYFCHSTTEGAQALNIRDHFQSENEEAYKHVENSDGTDDSISGNFVSNAVSICSPTQFPLQLSHLHSAQSTPSGVDDGPFIKGPTMQCQDSILNEDNYLLREVDSGQLKQLYEARGRELDRLMDEISSQKLLYEKKLLSLTQELKVTREEKEGLSIRKNQLEILCGDSEEHCKTLDRDLLEKRGLIQSLSDEVKTLKSMLEISKSTTNDLEQQVANLTSSNIYRKNIEIEDSFLKKVRNSHNKEIDFLNRKISDFMERERTLNGHVKELEKKLLEKEKLETEDFEENAKRMLHLRSRFETSHKQISLLISTQEQMLLSAAYSHGESGMMEELILENKDLKEQLTRVESILNVFKNDLSNYGLLLKMGVFKPLLGSDDSLNNLGLTKALNFDESSAKEVINGNPDDASTPAISESLKWELFKAVIYSKGYREEIFELKDALTLKTKTIKSLEKSLNRNQISRISDTEEKDLRALSALRESGCVVLGLLDKVCININDAPSKLNSDVNNLLLESIDQYIISTQKCNVSQHLIEDEGTSVLDYMENYFFSNIIEGFEKLQRELQLKDYVSSGINELLESFLICLKHIKEQSCKVLVQNADLEKKLHLQNADLQEKLKVFQIENKKLNKSLTDCKQNLASLYSERGKLEKENLLAMETMKKLSSHPHKGDKKRQTSSEDGDISTEVRSIRSQFDFCIQENCDLKSQLLQEQKVLSEMVRKYNIQLVDSCTNTDTPSVVVKSPPNQESISLTGTSAEQELAKENELHSFTDVYKSLHEKFNEEKDNLKTYYEGEILDLQNKLQSMALNCGKNETVNQYEMEIRDLGIKLSKHLESNKSLKDENQLLFIRHQEELRTITDELQNKELMMDGMKNEREVMDCKYSETLHCLAMDKAALKKELAKLKNEVLNQRVKYSKVKDKFLKLKKNFDKYKTCTDERMKYYISKLNQISKGNKAVRMEQLEAFKEWLEKMRSALNKGIGQIISDLKEFQLKFKSPSQLERILLTLQLFSESLSNLKVQDI